MANSRIQGWSWKLQDTISPTDRTWSYTIATLPRPEQLNSQGLLKCITAVSSDTKQCITLRLSKAQLNRAIVNDTLDSFISISFADFRLYYPAPNDDSGTNPNGGQSTRLRAPPKESADYVIRLLRSGIVLNGVQYNFYGHSNSQLKSKTCYLFAGSKVEISEKVGRLGEFANLKTVAKKAKRIGLLFSTAQAATEVNPDRCEDIPDIARKDYIFTDGCGLISRHLANLLVKQIRYRGYKGVLTLEPSLNGQTLVQFRDSMRKFKGGNDLSFSVVDFSKPYAFGNLNDEVIILLHSLGISESVFLQKQLEHLQSLSLALTHPQYAFRFLTYCNRLDLAEKVIMDGVESIGPSIGHLVTQEYDKMLNKRDEQRCRIMIPKSRLLFGVCDPKGGLKEGECAVKVTMDGDGQPRQLSGMEILVTRNPCLHPGDLRKFKAVEQLDLAHLVDCIVFPTCGKRPSADMMSGGDLDGDTFFVCWDAELIPPKLSEPAHYQGAKEPVSFKAITDDDRLVYFARYSNASLGRVKNLYLSWARLNGPMSRECQELNHLFSKCVDGNRIKVPQSLQSPPPLPPEAPPFILDVLHEAARDEIVKREKRAPSFNGYSYNAIQRYLSQDDLAMSEFELIKLTHRWCQRNDCNLASFLEYFDMNGLGDEEKAWVLAQLPSSQEMPSLVFNALTHSSLLTETELRPFGLHVPGLRWKRVFDSAHDRMARFLHVTSQTLELFHKKLLVFRIDTRLSIAIYVPRKIEKRQECQVDDSVRMFAFPHSQSDESYKRHAVPTKINYRLYCDENALRLYEGQRGNTWVFLARPGSDDSAYRSEQNQGNRRRERQSTVDRGENYDCIASIALGKYSQNLQRHIGRVNRNGILGAEIYVISNRDTRALQILDLWLDFIETEEVLPLFEKRAREYAVHTLSNTDWSAVPHDIAAIARNGKFATFETFENLEQYTETLQWLLERNEKGQLLRAYDYLLKMLNAGFGLVDPDELLHSLIQFTNNAPYLSIAFVRIGDWSSLSNKLQSDLISFAADLLEKITLSVSTVLDLAVEPFKFVLSQITYLTLEGLGKICEKIALTVHVPEIALDLLLGALEPECSRLLVGRPRAAQHFFRSMSGIAIDHIDEASQSRISPELFDLKRTRKEQLVRSNMRIDAPSSTPFRIQDHVRLIVGTPPSNSLINEKYSMDALVETSEPGRVTFHCLHPLPSFVEECSWKAQNCGSFVTSKAMMDAVTLFAQDETDVNRRLLGASNAEPTSNNNAGSYVLRDNLNDSQNEAVRVSLDSPLTCLWGPPGTGKTYTVVVLLEELLKDESTQRILMTAPTHNAVDNVLRKFVGSRHLEISGLVEPVRVTTDVRRVAEDLKGYTCDAMMGKDLTENFAARKKAQERISRSRLIFTTCAGAGLGLLRNESFETVIVDEASQQTEPASLVPLVKGCTKAILVGDHLQLRATVQKNAVLQQFDVSLFERLYSQDHSAARKVMLKTQYRMHREICSFSSREFYDNNLSTAVSDASRPLPESDFPWPASPTAANEKARMIFVQCSTPEDIGRQSKSNKGQAGLCAEICKQLMRSPSSNTTPAADLSSTSTVNPPSPSLSLAVLTPYTAQSTLLRSLLPPAITVSSIDGFQGREADIVILVTVRCNVHSEIGFLKDLRRLNVAMTRARTASIVIGDRDTLTKGPSDEESTSVWKRLVEGAVGVELEKKGEGGLAGGAGGGGGGGGGESGMAQKKGKGSGRTR